MSLATRCPACGTVFRVVRDQLKVSEGWVRCGRCSEVFDAGQRLFELEQAGATAAAPPNIAASSQEKARVAAAIVPVDAPSADSAFSADAAASIPAMARLRTALAPPSDAAVLWAPERDRAQSAAPTPDTKEAAPETYATSPPGPEAIASADTASEPAAETTAEAVVGPPTPDFVLRAERAARWRHPARRSALATLSLLLAALLATQVAMHYRDALAAGWPASRPGLQAACKFLGCRIEAPRRIDGLSVDSSGLVRVEGSTLYRLSLVLQNKAPTAVRMPAIDLALTDTQGQTMARRVLFAAELGNPSDSLPARGEVALQGTLDLGARRVAGYTVELFYP